MQLQLLGSVAVEVDGVVVAATRPMEAAVLAALAASPNRVVSRDRLVDMLWGENPPASAAKSLQSHVMRVRKLLDTAGASQLIETVEGGYRLALDVELIDASQFERLTSDGRAALDRGDAGAAVSALTAALELWTGDPLSPVTAPGLATYRIRLEELYHQAFELYAEAKLADGDHDALIVELQDAVATDPFRERLWAMLMLALYRSGRQAEALAEYQRVREILMDELGVDPGLELRELELKILNQDAVLAVSHIVSSPVMPPVLESEATRLFVGRATELAKAQSALVAAASGRSSLLLVSGEAGIGKSVFTSQVALLAVQRDFRVLYGRCDEQLAAAYQPFVQALRSYLGSNDEPALGPGAGELSKLAPELISNGTRAHQSDPETERLQLFDAVVSWLAALTADRPLMLVFEDLHWADAPTLSLLRHVVRRSVAASISIVVNFRPHGVSDRHGLDALLTEASRQQGTVELALAGLGEAEITELLRQSGDADDESSSSDLLAASGGNPLYVSELAEHLRAGGSLPTSERSDVPSGIQRTVDARMRVLSDSATRVLKLAALVGQVFRFDAIRMAFPGTDVEGPLLQAVDSGLIVELPGRDLEYRFTHALTRLAISAGLSEPERARHHRQIGRALEALPTAALGETARHFREAIALGEHEQAIHYTIAAAHEALAQYGDTTAADLFEVALTLQPDAHTQAEIKIGLGEAQRRLGSADYRDTLLEAYESAALRGDGEQMAQALLSGYRGTFSRALRVDRKMVDRLASAEVHLDGDSVLLSQVLANHAVELAWDLDWQQARSLSDDALAMARRLDDDATLGRVLALRHWTVYDSLPDRLATTAELDAVLVRLADPALQFEAAGMAAFTMTRVGDHGAADRRLREAAALADKLDRKQERWMLLIREYAAAMRDGRYDDAEQHCNAGLALGQEMGQPDAVTQFGVQQFWLAGDRLPQEAGVAMMMSLLKDLERSWPLGWPAFAYRCAELGMRDEARYIVDLFDDHGLIDGLPRDQVWAFNLSALCMAASFLDDAALAARVMGYLVPVSGEHANSVFVCIGAVDRYLGLAAMTIGDFERADVWMAAAIETNAALPAWQARALLDRVELWQRTGTGDVGPLLNSAAAIAAELKLPVIADRCKHLSLSA